MKIKQFSQLSIWKIGMEICEDIYKMTRHFPRDEQFGLVSQMRRASVSIPSNISEGFNRHQPKDFRRFLQIAHGSCAELETQILLCYKLGLINYPTSVQTKLISEQKRIKKLIQRINERVRIRPNCEP